MNDRRMNRSNVPGTALSLALAAAARRSGARAAVISDEHGLLVAGAGADFNHHHIAAFAPIAEERRRGQAEATLGQPLFAAPIHVNGARLFFAAVGGSLGDVGQMQATAGRILS